MVREATKTVATWLGVVAGLAGLEHGYFEVLQGNIRPTAMAFPSWGPVLCDPEEAWHACEPAMSILPNFLITGILTILISLAIIVWAGLFLQRKHGGWVLISLSIALLLFGGGLFPPIVGIVGSVAGIRIKKKLSGQPGNVTHLASTLWPWPLIILVSWLFGQFIIGHFFNDFLKSIMGYAVLIILAFLPLSVYSAYAHDFVNEQ